MLVSKSRWHNWGNQVLTHNFSFATCSPTLGVTVYHLFSRRFWLACYREREREMFYLMMHSTHFIYGYMASDIWLRTILIVRKETRCHHIGYSYRLTARVLLYAPSHRQDNTYHSLCYTSHGVLAGTRDIWMEYWVYFINKTLFWIALKMGATLFFHIALRSFLSF